MLLLYKKSQKFYEIGDPSFQDNLVELNQKIELAEKQFEYKRAEFVRIDSLQKKPIEERIRALNLELANLNSKYDYAKNHLSEAWMRRRK